MSSNLARWKSINFLVVLLFLQSIVYVTVFLDVPIARQAIGLIYFTFVPGFIIVKLLKLGQSSGLERFLFSVGFSIAFLMLAGVLINEFLFLFGISKPLSLMPLLIILNSAILVGGVFVQLRHDGLYIRGIELNKKSLFALIFLCLPILSIAGAIWANTYESNLILLITIVLIPILFGIAITSKKLLPPKLYPLCVFMIAIALLYHSTFISNYIVHFGSDVSGEYFVFKTTEVNAYWNTTYQHEETVLGRVNSMLSVTILPTVYSVLLNMDPIWMFKILFPLIFSLVPLGLYQVLKAFFRRRYAFISVFLFMAQSTFYTEALGLNKQIVGELFFVLLLFVILNEKMKPLKKMVCFMVFSFALVTSHYAIAEVFMFLVCFTLVSLVALKRRTTKITVSMVMFFFVVMFSWYLFTSNSAVFQSFIEFGEHIYSQLGDFLNPASRGETVLRGLGFEAPATIWNSISRIFAYITQAFIVIGFVGFVRKRKRLGMEYFILTSLSMALLAALILVPGLASTLNMTRFYHLLLFFLSPLCVVGAETIVTLVSRQNLEMKTSVLLLIVLIPYFLFQTSFVYEVTQSDSYSVSLSKYRMSSSRLYIETGYSDAYSVSGVQWLSKSVAFGHSQIYADFSSRSIDLRMYSTVHLDYSILISNTTEVESGGLVFLGPHSIVEGTMFSRNYIWNLDESHVLDGLNKIYSNGRTEVYMNGQ